VVQLAEAAAVVEVVFVTGIVGYAVVASGDVAAAVGHGGEIDKNSVEHEMHVWLRGATVDLGD
jgi:hypothetical protein